MNDTPTTMPVRTICLSPSKKMSIAKAQSAMESQIGAWEQVFVKSCHTRDSQRLFLCAEEETKQKNLVRNGPVKKFKTRSNRQICFLFTHHRVSHQFECDLRPQDVNCGHNLVSAIDTDMCLDQTSKRPHALRPGHNLQPTLFLCSRFARCWIKRSTTRSWPLREARCSGLSSGCGHHEKQMNKVVMKKTSQPQIWNDRNSSPDTS